MPSRHLGALFAAIALAITAFGAGALLVASSVPVGQAPTRHLADPHARASRDDAKGREVELATPCEAGRDIRSSDLCAQWKAADAARDAARWAMIGTVVALLGTFGLYWQISLTRRAVADTSEATVAMREANRIARENSHKELRAYLTVKSVTVNETEHDDDEFIFEIEMINNGHTPAAVRRIVFNATWIFEGGSTSLVKYDQVNIFNCHSNTPMQFPFTFHGAFEGCEKDGHILIVGRLEYLDAFDVLQKEGFGWRTATEEFGPFYDTQFPVALHAYSVETVLAMLEERKVAEPGSPA